MNPLSVWDTLLGWKGSFVRKGQRLVRKTRPLCIFWMVWKARNDVVFGNEVLSLQKLKFSFVNLLWLGTKLSIEDGPTTLVHFIDWVGPN